VKRLRIIAFMMIAATVSLPPALAWNIPGHMLSAAIAFQVLREESPKSIEKIKAVLEKHPWYANQWQARLQDVAICLALVIIGNENVCAKTRKSDESCSPISN
jgi:hypothetical protein